jgi:hypothetical protein
MINQFETKLTRLINEEGVDSYVNAPDFIIAKSILGHINNLRRFNSELYEFESDNADPGFKEDMDGDHASALSSAGLGTDEDYGSFGGNDD